MGSDLQLLQTGKMEDACLARSNIACVLADDPWAAVLRKFDLTEKRNAQAARASLFLQREGAEGLAGRQVGQLVDG